MKITKLLLSLILVAGFNFGQVNLFAQEEAEKDEIEEVFISDETTNLQEETTEEIVQEDESIEDEEGAEETVETMEIAVEPFAVFNDGGITLRNYSTSNGLYANRYFSVYLKQGESFRFTATYGGVNTEGRPADIGKYFIISPSGTQVSIDYPSGERVGTVSTPDPVDGVKSITITADEEGIYIVKPFVSTGNTTHHNINFNIADASGSHQAGRVWSDYIQLEQFNMWSPTSGHFVHAGDFIFYHVTSTGYVYRQKLMEYNGVGSMIFSDPVGVMDTRESGCVPAYGDTPGPSSTIYQELSAACKAYIIPNHLFLERPDATLPQTATTNIVANDGSVTGTKEVHVLPLIEDNRPAVTDVLFERSNQINNEGEFKLMIENHQGPLYLNIKVDYENDGVIDEVITKTVLANSYGETVYEWDGLNNAGEEVSILAKITAETLIDRTGEIHFVNYDVEKRGGMYIERLTAVEAANIGDGTLYYNSSLLPIDLAQSNLVTLPNPIEGSYDSLSNPTFRRWSVVYFGTGDSRNSIAKRLASYEGRPTSYTPGSAADPETNNMSFGDGNLIDDWTFEPVDIRLEKDIPLVVPNVTIEKEVDKTVASMGDELMYSLVVTNTELYPVPNIQVMDEIILDGNKEYIIDSVTVDGVEMSDVLDTDSVVFEDNTVIVNIIELAAEQESVITFTIKVLDQAEGQTLKNSATMTAPNHEEPIESNEVETYIPYLARAINYYDCDKILIHQEWVDYGTNGKDAPSGYIYDLGLTVNVTRNTDVYAIGGCGFSIPNTGRK